MELLDLLREDGEPSGQVRWRTLVHLHGDWHRTSHVWVVRKRADGGHDLLLQKRSGEKDSFAGCYDISSAGHIPAGAVPEVLAHELAHIVTVGDEHGPEWKKAFEAIYSKYNELAIARFGTQEPEENQKGGD